MNSLLKPIMMFIIKIKMINKMTEKIHIELDLDKKAKIEIIAKAFNMTPGDFIKDAIKKEMGFIKSTLKRDNAKNDLESYYKFEINIDELKKLILMGEETQIQEYPLVEVESEIYQRLKKLSTITGIPIETIVSKELGDFFYSVGDIPIIFLDRHLGIENIKNPIEILEKMTEVIDIQQEYIEQLKAKDLVKHVEDWHKIYDKI